MESLVSPEDNYNRLRNKMLTLESPCVPWIGLYLRDLTYLGDGFPTFIKNKDTGCNLVNFDKCRKIATVLLEVQKFQKIPFQLPEDAEMRAYILRMRLLEQDENVLYSLSLKVESQSMQQQS